MCGIAGIVSDRPGGTRRQAVYRMLDLIRHRGPDDQGIWEDHQICLGHQRLSIIDLSAAGHQPMLDNPLTSVLVFNGEIYNYLDLRQDLEREGVIFQSHSDTEVLLHGYRQWGDNVVDRLQGFFAFAIWDIHRHRLFCARDPLGKKPFYYHWDGRRFIFASEVEAVVTALASRPGVDFASLSHYLWTGYFAPGSSVYESIRTLKAGHCLEVRGAPFATRQWPYTRVGFAFGRTSIQDYDTLVKTCDGLIGDAVRIRLQSDVPIGVLLSGGVDSSLVSLVTSEQINARVQTFTASFPGTRFDETVYARQVAEKCHSRHTETDVVMSEIPLLLPRLIEAYGEPFGDDSSIPTFCLFQAIKPYVKVLLTGDGGDEVFGGYKDGKLFMFRSRLSRLIGLGDFLPDGVLASLLASRLTAMRETGYAFYALRQNSAEAFCALFRGGWTRRWRKRMLRPEMWDKTGGADAEGEVGKRFLAAGHSDLERFLNMALERLTQCYLVKIDRASMAHSLEARSPILDCKLLALVTGIAPQLLWSNDEPKAVLKDLVDQRMGKGFARRPKMGFTPPLTEWLKHPEACAWVEQRLTARSSFAYSLVKPEGIGQLLRLHRRGFDQSGRLWKLLFLNEWHARFYGEDRARNKARMTASLIKKAVV